MKSDEFIKGMKSDEFIKGMKSDEFIKGRVPEDLPRRMTADKKWQTTTIKEGTTLYRVANPSFEQSKQQQHMLFYTPDEISVYSVLVYRWNQEKVKGEKIDNKIQFHTTEEPLNLLLLSGLYTYEELEKSIRTLDDKYVPVMRQFPNDIPNGDNEIPARWLVENAYKYEGLQNLDGWFETGQPDHMGSIHEFMLLPRGRDKLKLSKTVSQEVFMDSLLDKMGKMEEEESGQPEPEPEPKPEPESSTFW
jgi:hypothetical protein